MSDWQPIESAPKDGTIVRLRRILAPGREVVGVGLFGVLGEDAPSRAPIEPDPLNRLTPEHYESEARMLALWANEPKWIRENRMHAFPAPTHWAPLPSLPKDQT